MSRVRSPTIFFFTSVPSVSVPSPPAAIPRGGVTDPSIQQQQQQQSEVTILHSRRSQFPAFFFRFPIRETFFPDLFFLPPFFSCRLPFPAASFPVVVRIGVRPRRFVPPAFFAPFFPHTFFLFSHLLPLLLPTRGKMVLKIKGNGVGIRGFSQLQLFIKERL